MKKFDRGLNVLLIVGALFALRTSNTYAYVDMASGSYIIQMGIAGFLTALVSVKLFWNQIKAFVITRVLHRTATKQTPPV